VLSIDEADHHNRAYSLEQGIGMSPDLHLPLHVGHSRTVTGLEPVDKMRVAGGRNRWRDAHAVETKTEGLGLEMLRQLGGGHGHTDSGSQSGFECPRVLGSEVLIDLTRRVGAIESVEMDSPNLVVQQVAALLGGPMNSYPGNSRLVFATALDGPLEPRRDAGSQRQLGHPHHVLSRGDRHDAGKDWHLDARQLTTLTKIVEIRVTEKELGTNAVGSRINLALEMIDFQQTIRSAGMPLGKPGHADPEPSRVGNIRVRADVAYKLLGELECIAGTIIVRHVSGRVSPECQDVLDARGGITVEDRPQLFLGVANTGQVGNRGQVGLALNPHDQVMGPLPGRAARSISHRDERGPQSLQLGDRLEQLSGSPVRLGREELEAEGGRVCVEDIEYMHVRDRLTPEWQRFRRRRGVAISITQPVPERESDSFRASTGRRRADTGGIGRDREPVTDFRQKRRHRSWDRSSQGRTGRTGACGPSRSGGRDGSGGGSGPPIRSGGPRPSSRARFAWAACG